MPRASVAVGVRVDAQSQQQVAQALAAYGRQAEFALLLTQNDIVLETQASLRSGLRGALTVRSGVTHQFLADRIQVQLAKLTRARDRLEAFVRIADPETKGGRGKASLLATLASPAGGEKVRRDNYLAVPTKALRPSPSAIVPRTMYPTALGVAATRTIEGPLAFPSYRATRTRRSARVTKGQRVGLFKTAKGRYQILGKDRTFAIDPRYMPRASGFGVYQRTGPGPKDIRKLWKYVAEVRVPNRVPAQRIMDTLSKRLFADRFTINLERALRTAR
jgi:hypothetical protein